MVTGPEREQAGVVVFREDDPRARAVPGSSASRRGFSSVLARLDVEAEHNAIERRLASRLGL
jgi:hypothetical protein